MTVWSGDEHHVADILAFHPRDSASWRLRRGDVDVLGLAAPERRLILYGISDMTLWRWLQDVNLKFPKPIVIEGRRYWHWSNLDAWDAAQATSRTDVSCDMLPPRQNRTSTDILAYSGGDGASIGYDFADRNAEAPV